MRRRSPTRPSPCRQPARVEAAIAARELAQKRLDAEQSRFEVGLTTNFFVVQAQRDLRDAENTELRALADYRKSLVNYERAQSRARGRWRRRRQHGHGVGGGDRSSRRRYPVGRAATNGDRTRICVNLVIIGALLAVAGRRGGYFGVFSRDRPQPLPVEPGGAAAGPVAGQGGPGGGRASADRAAAFRPPITVQMAPATKGDISATMTVVGNLIGLQTVDVVPRTGGPARQP